MSTGDEWPQDRYPPRLRIHGIGRSMTWAGPEPQEAWQEIIGYEPSEYDVCPDSAVEYVHIDVHESERAAHRALVSAMKEIHGFAVGRLDAIKKNPRASIVHKDALAHIVSKSEAALAASKEALGDG